MTDLRKCPICHDGWEQDGDDVRKCRACGGSALLGPMIPKAVKYGPYASPPSEPVTAIIDRARDVLPKEIAVSYDGYGAIVFSGKVTND